MLNWAERGRLFQALETSGWSTGEYDSLDKEKSVPLLGPKRGRVDILANLDDGTKVVVEVKATDWDAMAEHRVRPNLLRHVRQLSRYRDYFTEQGIAVHPALVYPAPRSLARRQLVESLGEQACVEVVWR